MILNKKRKILVILLVFLFLILFYNVVKANTLTNNISNIFNFINKNIIGQIKKDFCHNYISAISNGDWKEGEFRTNLGKKNCASYTISNIATTSKITQTTLNPLNGSSVILIKKNPNKSFVNNPSPNVYIPNTAVLNSNLDISQIISLTNEERKNNDPNLVNLKENNILKNIAIIRIKDMFINEYFEHNSPTGDNAVKEATKNNYIYITIGENIALGNFDGSKGLVKAWMNSPGHRANILNKNYTEIGVYAEQGLYKDQSVWISAQIFGRPISDCSEPEKILKNKIIQEKVEVENMLTQVKHMDEYLKTLNINTNEERQIYNLKNEERNKLAELYNNLSLEIKNLVIKYNKEVEVFNLCITIIK